jgi:pyridoxamine 5'-phosphate oxidase
MPPMTDAQTPVAPLPDAVVASFERLLAEAKASGDREPTAMTVATVGDNGRPSARTVLLKHVDARGFVFYTNFDSRKGRQLAQNPRAALLFHWKELARQVRIEGPVERVTPAESAEYFAGRALGSRISAVASPQSRVIGSREELERRVEALTGRDPAAPANWGGFVLNPQVYELWQRGEHRLHDRLRYRRADGGRWVLDRLAP